MTTYKLITDFDGIERHNDDDTKSTIPAGGTGWAEYQAWLALGNEPLEADPPPPPDEADVAKVGVKAWFESHPNAALLFNLSITDLDTEIDSICDALFPLASAANKNKMKLWMKTVSHSVRALSKREGFT